MSILSFDTRRLANAPAVRVWRHRDYALFMSGIGPHYVTGWMQRLGVGWLAWELTHSPAWLGAVAAADLMPMIALAPFAGALVDRWNPQAQMKMSLILLLIHGIALSALTMSGAMTIELLFAITLINGMLMPVYNAARTTIVPACVPREDFSSGVSLDSSFFHSSRFIGPMIAALVIRQYGIGACFLAHVVGIAFFILQVFRMRVTVPVRQSVTTNLMQDVVASLLYVRQHPGIFPLFMLMTVASLASRPLQDFLPGFADGVFKAGADGFAWLAAGMGIGAMIGAACVAFRGHARGITYVSIVSAAGLAIGQLGFVATSNLMIAVCFAAVQGFTLTSMATGIAALTQVAVADDMRGRVMSLNAMIFRGVPAIGALIMGFAAEVIGLRSTFAIASLLCAAAWLWMAPAHRRIERAMLGDPD